MSKISRSKKQIKNIINDNNLQSHEDLILNNMKFALKIAHEYKHLGVNFNDLEQEAYIGLVEAASKFNRSQGIKFISYAVHYIRMRIRKVISFNQGKVYQPASFTRKLYSIRNAINDNPDMSVEEISQKTNIKVKAINKVLKSKITDVISVNATVNNDDGASGKTIESFLNLPTNQKSQEEIIDRNSIFENIDSAIDNNLSNIEKTALKLRYVEDCTLEHIGNILKKSPAGVKSIIDRSIYKIREELV